MVFMSGCSPVNGPEESNSYHAWLAKKRHVQQDATMSIVFISHADCLKHQMGAHHPECPERLSAIDDQLIASGIAPLIQRLDAPRASIEQLELVHPLDYIEQIQQATPSHGLAYLDPDTALCPDSWNAALRAAGAAIMATDLVMGGQAEAAFCSVRPPGHHAEHDRAMGFCVFNNIALAVRHAMTQHALERVAIVDFDVHHGNGTEEIFAGDERVLMLSTFRHPYYPHSGADSHAPNMVNVPLPRGADGAALRQAFEQVWLPRLEAHRPQMLFISAGFDAHAEDDMGGLRFTEADYAWITSRIKEVAQRHAAGRIVSVLEGGYALSALGRSVVAHLKVLGGL
jgi:acetoin utilization deacetylase AcuC-like enzyme